MYKIFVTLGAYFLVSLTIPVAMVGIGLHFFCDYCSDVKKEWEKNLEKISDWIAFEGENSDVKSSRDENQLAEKSGNNAD